RRLVVARLHHDLVVRGATGFEHATEHACRVVRAGHVIEQADEIRAAAAQTARRRARVIVELADHAQHALARVRLHGRTVVDHARDGFDRYPRLSSDVADRGNWHRRYSNTAYRSRTGTTGRTADRYG